MRRSWLWLGSVTFLTSTAASAADQLKFGKPPEWVVPQAIPPADAKGAGQPVALLLHDQQVRLEPKTIVSYAELAFKIQKPEGLDSGNLSIAWNPATDTVTVNRLEIRRGTQTIDVLKTGQSFTTMRRESNLEMAMLDGMLTANIQPEGLQEGDTLVMATTTEHADPVLKGHVETVFAPWGENQIRLAHARLLWPSNLAIKVQKTGDIPAPQLQTANDGFKVYELTMRDTDPVIAPKGAPLRFRIGRMGEATDFQSWADAAKLFVPLFAGAAVVPASGPLRDEVENIRKASSDPKTRAEQALQLVEGRIRYVALLMGQGGLVPASAETTWSRRFGDCKAKTALLLAILHELGIAAEPVAANPVLGDIIGERLPSIAMFNHVLVRAHIGGKDYWLDGTRTGDNHLDDIEVPDFGWVLPLMTGAQLVHLVPPPLKYPTSERRLEIDATAGILAPAPTLGEQILRGDVATVYNARLSSLSEGQRQEYFRSYWTAIFDSLTVTSASAKFDKVKNELRLTMAGEAKLDWNTGYFHVPDSGVGYEPNFDRPPGPQHDAPIAVGFPVYASTTVRLHMPAGFLDDRPMGSGDVRETLAGVEYVRTSLHEGDFLTIQTRARSLMPEVAYKDAVAAKPRLRALSDEDAALPVPNSYRVTAGDLVELAQQQPGSAKEFIRRGNAYLDARKFNEAIDDFTKALELDPKNVNALSDRGLAHVWKNEFDLAKGDLAAAQTIEPGNAVVMRARGLNAEHEGDCDGAINFYSKSLEVDPANNFALGHRAICEHQVGKEDEALADSSRALRADHRWMDLRVLRANAFYLRGDTAAVAKEAELLTHENPGADYAYVAAGKIYARIGRKADAMKAFNAALAIKPLPYIFLNRAQTRPFTDYAGRLADIEAALKLDPNDVDTLAEKAEQLAVTGNAKEALKLYDQVHQLAPANDHLALRRAILLYKSGMTSEAEKVIAAQHAKAKTATALNSLCWTKATAGILLESALQDCLESLKLQPDSIQTLDSLAFVDLRLGKTDEAITMYSKAISGNSGSASYMGRSIAYARKGDKVHSDADRAEAMRLDHDAETRFAEYGLKR